MFVFIFSMIKKSRNKYGIGASNQIYNLKFTFAIFNRYLKKLFSVVCFSLSPEAIVVVISFFTNLVFSIFKCKFIIDSLVMNYYETITCL